MRCPFPFAVGIADLARFLAVSLCLQTRLVLGHSGTVVVVARALAGIPYCLRKRKPVSWAGYKRWLRCRKAQLIIALSCPPRRIRPVAN